jgi:hypothetical protein
MTGRDDWWSANAGSREAAEHRQAVRGKHHGEGDQQQRDAQRRNCPEIAALVSGRR